MLIGYNSNQKGYRCLDMSTNRVFIPRHVIFDKDSFLAREDVILSSKINNRSSSDNTYIISPPLLSASSITTATEATTPHTNLLSESQFSSNTNSPTLT